MIRNCMWRLLGFRWSASPAVPPGFFTNLLYSKLVTNSIPDVPAGRVPLVALSVVFARVLHDAAVPDRREHRDPQRASCRGSARPAGPVLAAAAVGAKARAPLLWRNRKMAAAARRPDFMPGAADGAAPVCFCRPCGDELQVCRWVPAADRARVSTAGRCMIHITKCHFTSVPRAEIRSTRQPL